MQLVQDPKIRDQEQFVVLGQYLAARQIMIEELEACQAAGGPRTLDARGNEDLRFYWDQITGHLVEQNLVFADMFYRLFERDMLEAA